MKKILLYGIILGALIAVLKLVQYRFLIVDHAIEIYSGILALLFTILGIWMGLKLTRKKREVVVVEKIIDRSAPFALNEAEMDKAGVSKRELEVLQLMAEGMSNREIADKLFVSLNTVKTHSSNLFMKLDARRRTQAIQRAKELQLIP
jgi:DNA-binding CsgD family transcriptional regulator